MSRINPWAMHYQRAWEERSGDPALPSWLRVAALCYGMHKPNGHAPFKPGDIALVLATVDKATGEVRLPDKHNVQRAIRAAVNHGFLDPASSSLCLVVPPHAVRGGIGGAPEDVCTHHGRKGRVGQNLTHSGRLGGSNFDTRVGQILTPGEPVTCEDAAALYESLLGGLPEAVTS